MLRKEPPFGPLCLQRADINRIEDIGWRTLADGLAVHTSLAHVSLNDRWPVAQAESDALVGALLSLPLLRSLCLVRAPAAVLARLLGCPTLKSLSIFGGGRALLRAPASAALLCDALRANMCVDTLTLYGVDLWHDMDGATAVMATLQAHPSLAELVLADNRVPPEHAAAAGAALGELVAHSHMLETLDISECFIGDAGLGPIMDALPHSHLHTLYCDHNCMSDAFARERLLPAVRACASLRKLEADDGPAVREEAKLLLEQRR